MDRPTVDEVKALLSQHGLDVSQERLEFLAEHMQAFRPKVDELYDIDVSGEEIAVVFDPRWTGKEGG